MYIYKEHCVFWQMINRITDLCCMYNERLNTLKVKVEVTAFNDSMDFPQQHVVLLDPSGHI